MHYLRNIELKIKSKIRQTCGLTEVATLKIRSKRKPPVKHDKPDLGQPGVLLYLSLNEIISCPNRLSLVMSMMVSFVLSFFPRDVLDEILNLIESVSEDFPSYSCKCLESATNKDYMRQMTQVEDSQRPRF